MAIIRMMQYGKISISILRIYMGKDYRTPRHSTQGNEKVEVWKFWDELKGYRKKLIVSKDSTGTGVIFYN